MENSIDEATARLVTGITEAIECLILALESTGSLNRPALEYVLESRLKALGDDALEGVPLALIWAFLHPQEPKRPVLRLVLTGEAQP